MIYYIIKEVREELGISIETLSKLSKIDLKRLYELENNNISIIKDKELTEIAKALNVKEEALYYSAYEYEKVRKKLEKAIEEEGINSYKVRKLNIILDELHNMILQEDLPIKKFIGYNNSSHYELKGE